MTGFRVVSRTAIAFIKCEVGAGRELSKISISSLLLLTIDSHPMAMSSVENLIELFSLNSVGQSEV